MKKIALLIFLAAVEIVRAAAVGDTKISQMASASPIAWRDVIFSPNANSLVGFDAAKAVGAVDLIAGDGITITPGTGSLTIDATVAQGYLNVQAKNGETGPITRGQVVYISGASGSLPQVKLASNAADATSATTIGIVADASIAAGDTGIIRSVGEIKNVNTLAYAAGDMLYLGATPGSLTNVKPTAPAHLVTVGVVEKVNATSGEIYVTIQNGYELSELHDVSITAPATGQALVYDAATSLWKNSASIALNAPDLLLGSTSAPSAKSSLAARAPRQGLVFDGTAGVNLSSAIPAFGTCDFTVAGSLLLNAYTATYGTYLFSGNSNAFDLVIDGSGIVTAGKVLGASVTLGSWPDLGKNHTFAYTRSGTTGKWYVDGILVSTVTDSADYSADVTQIGDVFSSNLRTINGKFAPLIYNRALSASEVVSLYEAGAPAGADYNGYSTRNTATITNGPTYTWESFSGASSTGFTAAATTSTGAQYATATPAFTIAKGQKVRATFTATLNSGDINNVLARLVASDYSANLSDGVTLVAGSNTIELTANAASSICTFRFWHPNGNGFVGVTISNLKIDVLGLLLAPDIAQAGGGLTWYDTSGNAANITLPASGVTWGVPTSGQIASTLSVINSTASTSSSTGALVVTGGAGIGGALFTGGNATVGGTLTASGSLSVFGPSGVSSTGSRIRVDAGSTGIPNIALTQNNGAGYSGYLAVAAANNDFAPGTTAGRVIIRGQTGVDISSNDGISVGFKLDTSSNATLAGNLTVSGGTVSGVASGLTSTLIKASGFGYAPQNYSSIQLGGTSGRSLAFGVDVSAISGGNFTGASNEWIVPNTLNIRQVNAGGTDFTGYAFRLIDLSAEIGGNLTVSGTGTSTFAGLLGVGITSVSGWGSGQKYVEIGTGGVSVGSGGAASGYIRWNNYYNGSNDIYTVAGYAAVFGVNNAAFSWYQAGSGSLGGTVSFTEAMKLANNGNLLLGTTTDSGQKLQVVGTGYFSAGITIGGTSDVGTGGVLWQDAGSPYSTHLSGANIKFETGSNFSRTTALTLDSSQNATFAGQIKGNSTQEAQFAGAVRIKNALVADAVSAGFLDFVSGATRVVSYGADNSTAGTFSLVLRSANSSVNTTALSFDTSSNATFAGTAIFGKGGANATFSANGTTAESGIYTQANTGFVFFADNASATKGIKVDVNNGGLTVLSGGLTTATAGGSAGTWKLGVANTVSPTSPNRTITVDIGGTVYYIAAKTTND